MLTKEVKDILEGIHFFLTDGLKNEFLSGKVECMRRGLLLQLEGLRTTYPFLHFTSTTETNANIRQTSTSLPYLNVEQQNANSYRMSTSSSSSTNYSSTGGSNGSSTGYSGDGVVTPQNQNATLISEKPEDDEEFEEFEEIENCSNLTTVTTTTNISSTTTNHRRGSLDIFRRDVSEDKDDDCYIEDLDPVPFRILVGKCDYHGMLSKRSRSLLPGMRNSKSFRCVLAGPYLYFYLKEGDDKQKKVLNLNGYQVEEAPMDEHKLNSRRRDFAFQLVAPGKKTHIFFTSKKTSMERWMTCIKQAIPNYVNTPNGEPPVTKSALTMVEEDTSHDVNSEPDDEYSEFYEELVPEEEQKEPSFQTQPHEWKPTVPVYHTNSSQNTSDDTSEYYSVPEESDTPPASRPTYSNELKQPRIPPERPPLPDVLRLKALQLVRPLPEAPEMEEYEAPEGSNENDDEIYCEIEDAVPNSIPVKSDEREDGLQESMNDYLINSTSLSKEIFDTIKERVPSLPARSHVGRWDRMSGRSDTSTDVESYDVPSDVAITFKPKPLYRISKNGPTPPPPLPSLPPKGGGSMFEPESDEESDYKVPSATVPYSENFYQVPARIPVPVHPVVDCPKQPDKEDGQGRDPEEDVVNNNDEVKEERLSERNDENSKSEQNGDEKVEKNVISDALNSSAAVSESKTGEQFSKKLSSSSVKDLIAKLNQNDQPKDTSPPPIGINNSFRKNKLSIANSFEKSSSWNENKNNKIEVSKSITEIKNDLEVKEEQGVEFKETKIGTAKSKGDRFDSSLKADASSINGFCENFESEGTESKPAQECPGLYIAKFAFVSNKPGELSFNRGDEIMVKESYSDERMWKGVIKGREGLVLREYLRRKT